MLKKDYVINELKRKLKLAIKSLNFYGDKSSELASELAFLFEVGRDFTQASDYYTLAAENAAQSYANQEAIVLLQKAIAPFPPH